MSKTKSASLQAFFRARMTSTDEAHLDPGQRAELVNTFIFHALGLSEPKDAAEQPLHWDLLCYSFQMLLLYADQMQDEQFSIAMKMVDSFMHGIHYSGVIGEEEFLGPEREEHEGIWVDRIEGFMKEEGSGREE